MGQVQDRLADLLDRAVGRDAAQPGDEVRDRLRRGDAERRDGHAEDVERLRRAAPMSGRAGACLEAEILREPVRGMAGAPAEGAAADPRGRGVGEGVRRTAAAGVASAPRLRRQRRPELPEPAAAASASRAPRPSAATSRVARHSPLSCFGNRSGGVGSRWNQVSAGSGSAPFGSSLSQRSNHRTISRSQSMFGAG